MNFLSVAEVAKLWSMSERSVRNYCAEGRIPGAILVGKTWMIPSDAAKPNRKARTSNSKKTLLYILKLEKESKLKGGIYHKVQIELTYNSNHIEGSCLTHDQTRYIYETNTIGLTNEVINVDDIVETANHFKCVDMCIKNAKYQLTENFIRQLLLTLKNGTKVSREDWYMSESYKTFSDSAKLLLYEYNALENPDLKDILLFHSKFFLKAI